MGKRRVLDSVLVGEPEGESRFGVDGRIILKWHFRKFNGGGLD